jgi:GNAT superfamily N-acetyltransferase
MAVTVRDAAPGDAGRIAVLLTELGYPATGPEVASRLRYWLDDPFSRVLVADNAGYIVGCLSIHAVPYLEKTGRWARIESLVIDAAARRTGAGRLLVATAEDTARTWGCLAIEVTSARSRPEAHAFYQRLGFTDRCSQSARYWKTLPSALTSET